MVALDAREPKGRVLVGGQVEVGLGFSAVFHADDLEK